MGPLEALEEFEAIEGSVKVWRPWQLQQFELVQGTTVSTPSTRHFIRGYMILSIQSGTADSRYRNTRASDQGGEGMFRVFEPEEIWICQPKNATFQCLTVDPTWLQEIAAQMLQRERPLPHFSSHCLFDPSLSRSLRNFAASSIAPVSRLQQEEMLYTCFLHYCFSMPKTLARFLSSVGSIRLSSGRRSICMRTTPKRWRCKNWPMKST